MAPKAYFWLEEQLVPRLDSMFCVRESGAAKLRERFPMLADRTRFVPTWVDTEVFAPPSDVASCERIRRQVRDELQLDPAARVVVTVGRIDTQKNPQLLLDAFARVAATQADVALVYVGDGVLRPGLERRVAELGLAARVRFAGLMPQPRIADVLRGADVFALSSSYEGMPMAMPEALGSGLPVVTTDVGEVRKAVLPTCGEVVTEHAEQPLAEALLRTLQRLASLRGDPCVDAIRPFTPTNVLGAVYENYRMLGDLARRRKRA
jgi:glycosyltransferase involved in cell wall biosynthesis